MFTGIIECLGIIEEVISDNSNRDIWLSSPITHELKIDQSVAHNGVCLTVVEIKDDKYRVTAVDETLKKTNLSALESRQIVNIERCLKVDGRLDGHFVQGHVDAVGECVSKRESDGSWLFTFQFPEEYATLVVEKGAICINGVSLTAFEVTKSTFTVAIIPYTYDHTTFKTIKEGTIVNIEFDILGKYLLRNISLKG